MIESLIRWSIANRFFVLLATLLLVGVGLYSLKIRRWMRFPTCPMYR